MLNLSESELLDLVVKREAIPSVDKLQTCYARYFRRNEAQVQQGWNIAMSRKNYELAARAEQQHFLPSDHLLFSDHAPESVSMKIVQAPAEFSVPVKQDRRLSPSFKVKVEVKYSGELSLPLTLRAYIMTQHDKDNILSWHPEDLGDSDKKKITELKGSMSITHHFEASSGTHSSFNSSNALNMLAGSGFLMQGENFQDADLLGNNGGVRQQQQQQQQQINPASHSSLQQHQSSSSISPSVLLQIWSGSDSLARQASAGGPGIPTLPAPYDMSTLLGGSGNFNLGPGLQNIQNSSRISGGAFGVPPLGSGSGGGLLFGNKLSGDMFGTGNSFMGLDLKQQQQQQQQVLPVAPVERSQVVEHEFEFSNLELVRPTRMNKVYMVFATTLLDLDSVYLVYNVPTIGICRAEQREKACQKLGVPMQPMLPGGETSAPLVKMEVETTARKRDAGSHEVEDASGIESSQAPQLRSVSGPEDLLASLRQNLPGSRQSPNSKSFGSGSHSSRDDASAVPYSRSALRDWILEEYERTGLTRKLSELDLQALLSQAGFPLGSVTSPAVTTVSQAQWEEFMMQFQNVLVLLRQIANVWNLEEPCVISGFDMDRMGTITALANEPPGTFICRFSMSQPGCLVLTCKTAPESGQGGVDNLLHAIIKIDDLYERRVDTWIRDFSGATHVLDVYRQKRVDKRKVFASNYMHLRGISEVDPGHPSAPSTMVA